jgi:tetratricopeptide (TPR) repeat protein
MFRGSHYAPVADLSAYEAVLVLHYFLERLDKQACKLARSALEHAVEIEPSYARAWAALSQVYCDIHALNLIELDDSLALAEDCAQRAMSLDKNCQNTHYSSAFVGVLKRDDAHVVAACDNMVDLNPNAAYLVGSAAFWLGVIGRFDQAFPLMERSQELNPYYPGWFHFLPWLHAFSEQDFERALAAAYQFNMPTLFWDPLVRAATVGKLGRDEEAATAVQDLLELQPDFAARPDFYVGCFVHSDQARADVLDGLRTGGLA